MITAEEAGRWTIHPAAGVFLAEQAAHTMRETAQREVMQQAISDMEPVDLRDMDGRGVDSNFQELRDRLTVCCGTLCVQKLRFEREAGHGQDQQHGARGGMKIGMNMIGTKVHHANAGLEDLERSLPRKTRPRWS